MLEAIGVGSIDELFAEIPAELRLDRAARAPRRALGDRGLRPPRRARRAQRRRRLGDLLHRRRHVRPLRPGAGRRDHLALGVPHPVHAVPARGLAGRAAGDVRVPDRDLGADRAAGRQRLAVRGAVVGRLRRLPGARRAQGPHAAGRLARPAPARPRDARDLRPRLRRRGGRGRARATGVTDAGRARRSTSTTDVAAVFVQNPNFLGAIEDLEALAAAAHDAGALCVASVDAITLGVLRPPGECGVDVAVGEGQPLGNRLDFGGPSFGFFAATEEHLRRMPGRIAGETTDADGRRGFVLALQTREQHIRREKATHNICTSQALNALAGTIYLAWLGRRGIVELGELLVRRTAYARERLAAVDGVELLHDGAGRARVRAAPRRAGGRGPRPASPRRGSPPATRSAASTPSTRTGCWSRSPSAARRRTSTGSPRRSAARSRRAERGERSEPAGVAA